MTFLDLWYNYCATIRHHWDLNQKINIWKPSYINSIRSQWFLREPCIKPTLFWETSALWMADEFLFWFDQITLWSNLKYFCQSYLYFFGNFSMQNIFGDSWRENDASWKVNHGHQYCLKWHFWYLLFRL